jgi:transcriptional regulator with XRE-family HTH domain
MDFELLARQLLRAFRGSRSQVGFSRKLGYRTNVVYTWESGRRWPTAAVALRAAARAGVDVTAALHAFYGARPPWIDSIAPASPEGISRLLSDLRGHTPILDLARRTGRSRYAVARWLSGEAEPRLPDFLRLVEAASLRLLDLVAAITDPSKLSAARDAWATLEVHRRASYEVPWIPAVLRALELAEYAALPAHVPGWIASRLGISREEEQRCLDLLAESGQIRKRRRRWVQERVLTVDTKQNPGAERHLKSWWAQVGLERLRAGSKGLFSFNVFSVSRADLARLRELHLGYFRALRSIVAESTPGEHVAIANVQLFTLDD